jgi:ATP-dependent helicase/nuclease subunit A
MTVRSSRESSTWPSARKSTGAGQWTVVDFKTDAELGVRRAIYEEQLRLYVRAVEAATREGAHGVLLVV